jgi:hypothetical protein
MSKYKKTNRKLKFQNKQFQGHEKHWKTQKISHRKKKDACLTFV